MVVYWPYSTKLQVRDGAHFAEIVRWLHKNFGNLAYQHWNSSYQHPWLTVWFCDLDSKTMFDLVWA